MKNKILYIGLSLMAILITVYIFQYHLPAKIHLNQYIDAVYYINLDHRQDRNTEFLGEMQKTDISPRKIHRQSGVYKRDQGHLGCSLSHIACIERFIQSTESPNSIVAIFEDDFEFTSEAKASIQRFFKQKPKFDVCLLAANELSIEPSATYTQGTRTFGPYTGCNKVLGATTTAGYLVTREYAPILLQNFKEGAYKLEQSYMAGPYDGQYAIDQYWIQLQSLGNWYLLMPKPGTQRKSFSDIMGGVVDYKL